jgi:Ser/Thr protein kinase RdoA (MazF antagonist)
MIDDAGFEALAHDVQVASLRDLAVEVATRDYGLHAPDCRLLQYENNAVFAVTSAGERFALRLSPPATARVALGSEMAWLTAIRRDTALRVPEPVTAADGTYVVETARGRGAPARFATLMRWVEGGRPEPKAVAALAPALGELTAMLHVHGGTFAVPAGFARSPWGVPRLRADGDAIISATRRGRLGDSLLQLVERAVARVERALDVMGTSPAVWGLIHGDLHADNLAVDASAIGIIDFDDAGWGHYLYDVATLLDAVRRRVLTTEPDYRAFRSAFLRSYAAVRSLPSSLDADLIVFRAVREIATLAFITGTTNAEVASWGPERTHEIATNLAAYLADASDL